MSQPVLPGLDQKTQVRPMNTRAPNGADAKFPREAEALREMGCGDLLRNTTDDLPDWGISRQNRESSMRLHRLFFFMYF